MNVSVYIPLIIVYKHFHTFSLTHMHTHTQTPQWICAGVLGVSAFVPVCSWVTSMRGLVWSVGNDTNHTGDAVGEENPYLSLFIASDRSVVGFTILLAF